MPESHRRGASDLASPIETHCSDQIARLFADPRPASEPRGLPSAISDKAHSVPTSCSFGPDDDHGIKNTRAPTIESAIGPMRMLAARRTLPKHIELMPQDREFRFQPPSRFEALAQHVHAEQGNCDHRPQSCSDSVAAVTPWWMKFSAVAWPGGHGASARSPCRTRRPA